MFDGPFSSNPRLKLRERCYPLNDKERHRFKIGHIIQKKKARIHAKQIIHKYAEAGEIHVFKTTWKKKHSILLDPLRWIFINRLDWLVSISKSLPKRTIIKEAFLSLLDALEYAL